MTNSFMVCTEKKDVAKVVNFIKSAINEQDFIIIAEKNNTLMNNIDGALYNKIFILKHNKTHEEVEFPIVLRSGVFVIKKENGIFFEFGC